MSNLTVSQISGPAANSNQITIPSGHSLYAPGHIIQVIQTHVYSQSTVSVPSSYTTFTNVPDLTATITPKSSSSKIYIVVRWMGEFSNEGATWNLMWNLKRNGSLIGRDPTWPTDRNTGLHVSSLSYRDADSSSTPESVMFNYLDSPGVTSSVTYQACVETDTAITLYTNRTVGYAAGGHEAGTSSITLMEVAQ
jgi:hypothetical protein